MASTASATQPLLLLTAETGSRHRPLSAARSADSARQRSLSPAVGIGMVLPADHLSPRAPVRSRSMRVGSTSTGRSSPRRPPAATAVVSDRFRARTGSVPDAVKETSRLTRGGSYKGRRPKFTNEERTDVWPEAAVNVSEQRFLQLPDSEEYTRLRTFSINPDGGVVSRGDSFRRRSETKGSTASSDASATPHVHSDEGRSSPSPSRCGSLEAEESLFPPEIPKYEVSVLGAAGTGKTSLINQFMSSDAVNPFGQDLEEPQFTTVSLSIEGVVSELRFTEAEPDVEEAGWIRPEVSAYLILYCADSRASFKYAARLLKRLKQEETSAAIHLVSNKIDLVRRRVVSEQEGTALSSGQGVDQHEISVALNLSTDELLIATLAGIKAARDEISIVKRGSGEAKRSLTPSTIFSAPTLSLDTPDASDATPDFTRSILRFSRRRKAGSARGAKRRTKGGSEDAEGASCTNLTQGLNNLVQRIWRRRFSKSCDSLKV